MKRVLDLTMPKVEADKEDMHSHSTNKQPTMPKFARSDFQRSRSYEDLASSDSLSHMMKSWRHVCGGHPWRCPMAGVWDHESTWVRWLADGPITVKPLIRQWSSYAADDGCWAVMTDNHTMMLPPRCRCWYDEKNLTSYYKNTWKLCFMKSKK